jgi:hypothetical protein
MLNLDGCQVPDYFSFTPELCWLNQKNQPAHFIARVKQIHFSIDSQFFLCGIDFC